MASALAHRGVVPARNRQRGNGEFQAELLAPLPRVEIEASKVRSIQPVLLLATGLAKELDVPLQDVVQRGQTPKQLKDVFDYHERIKLLENVHNVISTVLRGKSVLLVDDPYRSGATLNAVTEALRTKGKVSAVYAFAPTRTRSAS